MSTDFAAVAVAQAGEYENPRKKGRVHRFERKCELKECIHALHRRALTEPLLAALPQQLNQAAAAFAPDSQAIPEVRMLFQLASGFEQFLKLIALVRYGHSRPELLYEGDEHVGFFKTCIGGLLQGKPDTKRNKTTSTNGRIVVFNDKLRDIASCAFDETRRIRNRIHDPWAMTPFEILQSAKTVFAAYLFAADQNLNKLSAVYRYFEFLRRLNEETGLERGGIVPGTLTTQIHTGPTELYLEENSSIRGLDSLQAALVERGERGAFVAITGDRGAGKTSVILEIVRRVVNAKMRAPFTDKRLPVLVRANQCGSDTTFASLVQTKLKMDDDEFQTYGQNGDFLFVVDGLNEVPTRWAQEQVHDLESLTNRFQACSFLIGTSYDESKRLRDFEYFCVVELTDEEIDHHVEACFTNRPDGAVIVVELLKDERMREICRRPLLLTTFIKAFDSPHAPPAKIGEALHAQVRGFLRAEGRFLSPLEPLTVEVLLSHIAYVMCSKHQPKIPKRRALGLVEDKIALLQSNAGAVDALRGFTRCGIMRERRDDQLEFVYPVLRNYFAALALIDKQTDDPDLVTDLKTRNRWKGALSILSDLRDCDHGIESSWATITNSMITSPRD